MANRLGLMLYCLRRAGAESAGVASDRQLLDRFLAQRDEPAFEALLQRHGPMVLAVCRRLLDEPAEVDDAFQATFLVLVRRARALAWNDSIGGWLHQVARRVALRARSVRARLRSQQREIDAMQIIDQRSADRPDTDLRLVLDEELDRLPARLRDPLVLCYLEGKTHEEAARELGCPRGSMDRLLTRGQDLLRDRLRGRGLAAPAGLAALLAAEESARAAVPLPLTEATLRTAVLAVAGQTGIAGSVTELAEGVIQAMIVKKMLKTTLAALVLVAMLAGGLGYWWQAGRAADTDPPAAAPAAPAVRPIPIEPYVVWSGPNSQVRESSYRRITSAEEWSKLWQAHGNAEAPWVNFDQCMVVAVFQGAAFNSRGIQVDSITEDTSAVVIRYVNSWYQTGEPGDAVTPFGIFVLPRLAKPLVLEENVQRQIGGQPVWQLRARIDPGKDTGTVVRPPDVSPQAVARRIAAIAKNQDQATPLRDLVREGAVVLNRLGPPVREFVAPADNPNAANQFRSQLENSQKQIALIMYQLDVMLDELERLAGDRANEPKKWQGHYDYIRAHLACRIAQLYEYNAQLGQMRAQFPPRDPAKEKGWQLVRTADYQDRDAGRYGKRARALFQQLAREQAGAEYADIAAAEEKAVVQGFKWQGWPQ